MEAERDARDGQGWAPTHTHCQRPSGGAMSGGVSEHDSAGGLREPCTRCHTHTAATQRGWAGVSAETRRSGVQSQSLIRGSVALRCIAE